MSFLESVRRHGLRGSMALVGVAATLLVGGGCGNEPDPVEQAELSAAGDLAGETVVVGSGLTTESRLLGELAAIALEARGAEVERVEGTSRDARRDLLGAGDIDLYWDRARTAWASEVDRDPASAVPLSIIEDVALADATIHGFRWLRPAGYAGGTGFVTAGPTGTGEIVSLREAVESATPLCVDPMFVDDPGGLDRLVAMAGPVAVSRLIEVDLGQIPVEVEAGTCIGQVDRTDPRLAATDTFTLLDDGNVLGPETPVPVVRVGEVTERAALVEVLNGVAPTLTLAIMQQLIGQVERDGLTVRQVAEGFLVARALIDPSPAG